MFFNSVFHFPSQQLELLEMMYSRCNSPSSTADFKFQWQDLFPSYTEVLSTEASEHRSHLCLASDGDCSQATPWVFSKDKVPDSRQRNSTALSSHSDERVPVRKGQHQGLLSSLFLKLTFSSCSQVPPTRRLRLAPKERLRLEKCINTLDSSVKFWLSGGC